MGCGPSNAAAGASHDEDSPRRSLSRRIDSRTKSIDEELKVRAHA